MTLPCCPVSVKLVTFLASMMLIFSGCSSAPNEPPVATLGKSVLTRDELRYSLSYQNREDSITQAAMYLEDWLITTALYEKALQEGQDKDTLTQLLIEKSRRKIVASRYVARKLQEEIAAGKFRIDSSEVQAFYYANPQLLKFQNLIIGSCVFMHPLKTLFLHCAKNLPQMRQKVSYLPLLNLFRLSLLK